MTSRRALAVAGGFLLAGIALTGCSVAQQDGGGTSSSPAQPAADSSFNDQDVTFAQGMIPHHAQAVEMAEMILAKADIDPRVTELAQRIRTAQGPEIDLMTSWLNGWGESSAPSGHAGHGMDGMMTDGDLQTLGEAAGDEAARLFLDQMIAHHTGAISMAHTEIAEGQNTDATELAQKIADDQEAEIDEMNAIVDAL